MNAVTPIRNLAIIFSGALLVVLLSGGIASANGLQDVERRKQTSQKATPVRPGNIRKDIAAQRPTSEPEPEQECGEVVVQIPDMKVFPLREHLFGDTKIGDTDRRVTVRAYLKQTPMRIWITAEVNIREDNNNMTVFHNPSDTEFEGRNNAIVFDARQEHYGCEIEAVLNEIANPNYTAYAGPMRGDTDNYTSKILENRTWEYLHGYARKETTSSSTQTAASGGRGFHDGLIADASCTLDVDGDDKDKLGCTSIKFHPLRLRLKKSDPAVCDSFRLTNHMPLWLKPLKHYRGDSDISGNDRFIWIADSRNGSKSANVRVLPEGRVQLAGNVGIRELGPDYSSFDLSFALDIASRLDVPPHCKLASAEIVSDYLDQTQRIRAEKDENYHTYDGTGLFEKLICRTDTGTNDGMQSGEGGVGCRVYPRDIQINLVPTVAN